MSILAAPRKKQVIVPDPQNLTWANDSSGFGKKLMRRMGWKDGHGLGAADQGISAPIVLKSTTDTTGLGCKPGYDNVWIEHQASFDDLLASLNDVAKPADRHNAENPTAAAGSEARMNLEAVSKRSRARIHYHKFARGKDLSSASANDLSCVVAVAKRAKKAVESACVDHDAKLNTPMEDAFETDKEKASFNGSVSSESVSDYFLRKMQELKSRVASGATVSAAQDSVDDEVVLSKEEFGAVDEALAEERKAAKRERKRERRRRKDEADAQASGADFQEEHCEEASAVTVDVGCLVENIEDDSNSRTKKRTKKHR